MNTWEAILVGVSATLGVLALIAGIRTSSDAVSPVTTGFKILYYFLPYSLFLFAALSDLIVQELHFFPAAIFSSILITLNYFLAKVVPGGLTQDRDMCGIPGLAKVGSNILPQSILFVTSFMAYVSGYVLQRNTAVGYPVLGVSAGIALMQLGIFTSQCGSEPYYLLNAFPSGAAAVVVGSLIGGLIGYYFSKDINVSSGADTSQGSILGSKSPVSGPPVTQTPGVGTCSAPNDQDQFVCEAYKNGQLVTSTMVE